LPAEFDQRVVLALAITALLVLDRLHERLQSGAKSRATLRIEQAVEPDQAIDGLTEVQVTALVSAVRLGQRACRIDAVLEVLRHCRELARVH
jgi:flagellar biosynthesis protein FliR